MTSRIATLASIAMISVCSAEAPATTDPDGTVFRKPFTLTLQVDKERRYEEEFQKVPFVHKNDAYLFKGDEYGLSLQRDGVAIKSVTYQPDIARSDITLKFSQEVKDGGPTMMMLVIKNHTKDTIYMDALMTIPGKKGVFKTSILPLMPGLSGYESWPHPIVQLVLRNLRTTK